MVASAFSGAVGSRSLYGSHGKQRVSVGMTNRREQFSAAVDFSASFQPRSSSSTGGGHNNSSTFLNSTVTRSASRLGGQTPFDLRTSTVPSPTPGDHPYAQATIDASANTAMELAGALHNRFQGSVTPEAFFFNSRSVGAGGQLIQDRIPLENRRSRSSLGGNVRAPPTYTHGRSNSSMSRHAPPLPDHDNLLTRLTQHRSASGIASKIPSADPCIGSAGFLVPPTSLDVTAKSLAQTSSVEPRPSRHLSCTPHSDNFFGSRLPNEETHASRLALHATRSPSSHDATTYELNKYTPQQRHFFISVAGKDDPRAPSTMPDLPEAVKPKLRYELTDYHSTATVTQPPTNAGQHATEAQRFTNRDRGLASSIVPQVEQSSAHVLNHLKAARRRNAEDRVHANCAARDLCDSNRKEAYIQNHHSIAVAAYRLDKANREAVLRRQDELDEQSAASVNRFRVSPNASAH
ncbi:Hypothetical protein, putative [Bodo saltans]|uniref:Uncharacterized protein n=1 Tax=Bodo saltans TaxID=75058 RepID=A0A0S4IML6_BODSA|nr:Hypothetical protein, putative [Bodo saltans]|eukprot:CUE73566.1 Hypothetical protein, putative [Bodo saltans]